MNNPWIDYQFKDSFLHEFDQELVKDFNRKAKEEVKYCDRLLPDPYIGSVKSKILLLALNPGLSENDFETHANTKYKELHRKNLDQTESDFPFYYLNPELDCPGSKWWHKKMKWLIEEFDVKKIAQTFYCMQYMPYHSVAFKKSSITIPTQEYTKHVVESHIRNNLPVIIMRSKKIWEELVPELENYKNAFMLHNPRNPTLSPTNIGSENYARLISDLRFRFGKKVFIV